MSVVCISDTHNSQPELPPGDILIHAGDLSQSGSFSEIQKVLDWIKRQPHQHKFVIAGNHDLLLDPDQDAASATSQSSIIREKLDWGDIIYLQDTLHVVTCANGRRLRVFGSPRSPKNGNWAFQYPRSSNVWSGIIPSDVDILITHAPPRSHLDLLHLGCIHLLRELWRIQPRLHIFGHIHEGHGTEWLSFGQLQAAFERTICDRGGIVNLVAVLKEYLTAYFGPKHESTTLLVNAAVVGGLRDQLCRRAIKVTI